MTPTISEPSTRPARIRGKLLFTFAAIADTHVNEDERISTSPFPSTALTTARARYAFAAVNASRPIHPESTRDRDRLRFGKPVAQHSGKRVKASPAFSG